MFSKLRRPCAEWKSGSRRPPKPVDDVPVWLKFHQVQKEMKALGRQYEERKQYLEHVKQRIKELEKNIEEIDVRHYSWEMFHKDKDNTAQMQKVERERRSLQENQEMIVKLRKENMEMAERKLELQRQVEKYSVYKDVMEKVLPQTQFKDVEELAGNLENLLCTRDKLLEKRKQVEEQTDQKKQTLQALKDQHHLMLLQKNNELSQLQAKLDKARTESRTLEKKWDHIQETAAKKVVELGQIKMAVVNLYEQTGGVVGAEGVDISDTDIQLNQIQFYMKDLNDIVKQYQMSLLEKNSDRRKQKT